MFSHGKGRLITLARWAGDAGVGRKPANDPEGWGKKKPPTSAPGSVALASSRLHAGPKPRSPSGLPLLLLQLDARAHARSWFWTVLRGPRAKNRSVVSLPRIRIGQLDCLSFTSPSEHLRASASRHPLVLDKPYNKFIPRHPSLLMSYKSQRVQSIDLQFITEKLKMGKSCLNISVSPPTLPPRHRHSTSRKGLIYSAGAKTVTAIRAFPRLCGFRHWPLLEAELWTR